MQPVELVRRISELLAEEQAFVVVKAIRAAPAWVGQAWIVHVAGGAPAEGEAPAKAKAPAPGGGGERGGVEGPAASARLIAFLRETALQVFAERQARCAALPETGASGRTEAVFFFDPIAAPETLVVAGGGHIGVALADMAAQTGFRVVVIDDRPEFAARGRFPRAHRVLAGPFGATLAGLTGGPRTFYVIVTRGHAYDRECLEIVLAKPSAYIGMIGSRRRIKAVFESLAREGVSPAALEQVHSPIGLDIGAKTPAEIAVSILAELVAVRRGTSSGASLSKRGSAGERRGG